MTIFVKSKGDWFYCIGSIRVEEPTGEELFMHNPRRGNVPYPEEIQDFYKSDFIVNEEYIAVFNNGNAMSLYFDGMIGDNELLFSTPLNNTYTENFITNRIGKGVDFYVSPRLQKINNGDTITYKNKQALVLAVDNLTVVLRVENTLHLVDINYLIEGFN